MPAIRLVSNENGLQWMHTAARIDRAYAAGMRDRIVSDSARFIREHRERLSGLEFKGSFAVMARRRMLLMVFEDLVRKYTGLIVTLVHVCERIAHLNRSLDALTTRYRARKCRLGVNTQIQGFVAELKFREEEEQSILEEVYGVEMDIFLLGSGVPEKAGIR